MERRKFTKMRTGRQSYEMQGLIFFMAGNYKHLPPELREIVQESCRAAAGQSGNEDALLEYMTQGKSKVAVMMKYYIGSATTLDRMVRVFFVEMERRLTEAWKR